MYGATAGQVGILRFKAATNQAVCGIFPNDQFVPEFLFYLLLSRKDELIAKAAGNAQPNISQLKIKATEIPITGSCDAALLRAIGYWIFVNWLLGNFVGLKWS
jgi:restriction endonuclease S subunit